MDFRHFDFAQCRLRVTVLALRHFDFAQCRHRVTVLEFGFWNLIFENMADHNELGKIGEKLAKELLQAKGYEIMSLNFTYEKAEVDIIARKDNLMVCVEVKTRNSSFFGDPQSFVTPAKIKQIVKAMNFYLIENEITLETRFDIIAVLKNKTTEQVMHYEDAFYFF